MQHNTKNKIWYFATNILEISGIIFCIFFYTSLLSIIPWSKGIEVDSIVPIIVLFLSTGLSFYFMKYYVPIEKKRILFSVIEFAFILCIFLLLKVTGYVYSINIITAIIGLAFNIIMLSEVCIYFISGCKIFKF